MRVLVVEDSWYIATLVRSFLENAGMVITGAAATSADAERLVSENVPTVAVVDIKLRDGMAYGLIDRLNELGVRVVVVSGFSIFPEPLGNVGAVLQKPISGEQLLTALCSVLPAILQ